MVKVTETQKRTVSCPFCGARSGKPCRSSRIPGPNSFGGGWGGPPDLDTAHKERRASYLAKSSEVQLWEKDGTMWFIVQK